MSQQEAKREVLEADRMALTFNGIRYGYNISLSVPGGPVVNYLLTRSELFDAFGPKLGLREY